MPSHSAMNDFAGDQPQRRLEVEARARPHRETSSAGARVDGAEQLADRIEQIERRASLLRPRLEERRIQIEVLAQERREVRRQPVILVQRAGCSRRGALQEHRVHGSTMT